MQEPATIDDFIEESRTCGLGLEEWLRWQETLNPRLVDLGLDRLRPVAGEMGLSSLPMPVVTVAGTNGKGSSIAYLEAILERAGHPVAAYTSPYLERYNETLRIAGREVSDEALVKAFENVERARNGVALTFFEYRTLATFDIIRRAPVSVALLEVGLGGRLDAVNLVDADVAVVTTIDLDHSEWLGPDRESVGREKAGIFRRGRVAVCGDRSPPRSLVAHARALGTQLNTLGVEFSIADDDGGWRWRGPAGEHRHLPQPRLAGDVQRANAAVALMTLQILAPRLAVDEDAVRDGIAAAWLPGRQQVFAGPVERVVDVAHNPEAARALAQTLAARPASGRTLAVFALLADKDAPAVAAPLADIVDEWHTADLTGPRGRSGEHLAATLREMFPDRGVRAHPSVAAAWHAARAIARDGDRLIAFGSFATAREALALERRAA